MHLKLKKLEAAAVKRAEEFHLARVKHRIPTFFGLAAGFDVRGMARGLGCW